MCCELNDIEFLKMMTLYQTIYYACNYGLSHIFNFTDIFVISGHMYNLKLITSPIRKVHHINR